MQSRCDPCRQERTRARRAAWAKRVERMVSWMVVSLVLSVIALMAGVAVIVKLHRSALGNRIAMTGAIGMLASPIAAVFGTFAWAALYRASRGPVVLPTRPSSVAPVPHADGPSAAYRGAPPATPQPLCERHAALVREAQAHRFDAGAASEAIEPHAQLAEEAAIHDALTTGSRR